MKTRGIGKTALQVTEYSFGTAALGGLYRACPREMDPSKSPNDRMSLRAAPC